MIRLLDLPGTDISFPFHDPKVFNEPLKVFEHFKRYVCFDGRSTLERIGCLLYEYSTEDVLHFRRTKYPKRTIADKFLLMRELALDTDENVCHIFSIIGDSICEQNDDILIFLFSVENNFLMLLKEWLLHFRVNLNELKILYLYFLEMRSRGIKVGSVDLEEGVTKSNYQKLTEYLKFQIRPFISEIEEKAIVLSREYSETLKEKVHYSIKDDKVEFRFLKNISNLKK